MKSVFFIRNRENMPYILVTVTEKGTDFQPLRDDADDVAMALGEAYDKTPVKKRHLEGALDDDLEIEGPYKIDAAIKKRIAEFLEDGGIPEYLPGTKPPKITGKSVTGYDIELADMPLDYLEDRQQLCDVVQYKALAFVADQTKTTFNYEVKRVRAVWDASLSIPGTGRRGGWRCPTGTRFGGQITDRFGRNCGWGVARRIANAITNIGERLEDRDDRRRGRRASRAARRVHEGAHAGVAHEGEHLRRRGRTIGETLTGGTAPAPSATPSTATPPASATPATPATGRVERGLRDIARRLDGGTEATPSAPATPDATPAPRRPGRIERGIGRIAEILDPESDRDGRYRPRTTPDADIPDTDIPDDADAPDGDIAIPAGGDMPLAVAILENINQGLDMLGNALARRIRRRSRARREADGPGGRGGRGGRAVDRGMEPLTEADIAALRAAGLAPEPGETFEAFARRNYDRYLEQVRAANERGMGGNALGEEAWMRRNGDALRDLYDEVRAVEAFATAGRGGDGGGGGGGAGGGGGGGGVPEGVGTQIPIYPQPRSPFVADAPAGAPPNPRGGDVFVDADGRRWTFVPSYGGISRWQEDTPRPRGPASRIVDSTAGRPRRQPDGPVNPPRYPQRNERFTDRNGRRWIYEEGQIGGRSGFWREETSMDRIGISDIRNPGGNRQPGRRPGDLIQVPGDGNARPMPRVEVGDDARPMPRVGEAEPDPRVVRPDRRPRGRNAERPQQVDEVRDGETFDQYVDRKFDEYNRGIDDLIARGDRPGRLTRDEWLQVNRGNLREAFDQREARQRARDADAPQPERRPAGRRQPRNPRNRRAEASDGIARDSAARRPRDEDVPVAPEPVPDRRPSGQPSRRVTAAEVAETPEAPRSEPDSRSFRNIRNRFGEDGLPDEAYWRAPDYDGDDADELERRFGHYYSPRSNRITARGRRARDRVREGEGRPRGGGRGRGRGGAGRGRGRGGDENNDAAVPAAPEPAAPSARPATPAARPATGRRFENDAIAAIVRADGQRNIQEGANRVAAALQEELRVQDEAIGALMAGFDNENQLSDVNNQLDGAIRVLEQRVARAREAEDALVDRVNEIGNRLRAATGPVALTPADREVLREYGEARRRRGHQEQLMRKLQMAKEGANRPFGRPSARPDAGPPQPPARPPQPPARPDAGPPQPPARPDAGPPRPPARPDAGPPQPPARPTPAASPLNFLLPDNFYGVGEANYRYIDGVGGWEDFGEGMAVVSPDERDAELEQYARELDEWMAERRAMEGRSGLARRFDDSERVMERIRARLADRVEIARRKAIRIGQKLERDGQITGRDRRQLEEFGQRVEELQHFERKMQVFQERRREAEGLAAPDPTPVSVAASTPPAPSAPSPPPAAPSARPSRRPRRSRSQRQQPAPVQEVPQEAEVVEESALAGPDMRRINTGKPEYSDRGAAVKHLHEDGGNLADVPDGIVADAVLDDEIVGPNGQPLDADEILAQGLLALGLSQGDEFENRRFKFKYVKAPGFDDGYRWDVIRVVDKQTGEIWFLKSSQYGQNDGLLENVGMKIAEVLEFGNAEQHLRLGDPKENPNGRASRWIMMRDIGQWDHGRRARFGGRPWENAGRQRRAQVSPVDAARLAVMDFVFDNEDRHHQNFMRNEDDDGIIRLGIIDNGLLFGGRLREGRDVDATEREFEERARARAGWDVAQYRRGMNNGIVGLGAIYEHGDQQRREQFAATARRSVAKLRRELDTIFSVERIEANGVRLTDAEKAHLRAMRVVAEARLEYIEQNLEDLVRVFN